MHIIGILKREIKYGLQFIVCFSLSRRSSKKIDFHAYTLPFTMHSWSMNQRMVSIAATPIVKGNGGYLVGLTAPPNSVVATSGY